MAKCDTCGNDYDKVMRITKDGTEHIFDSFECAVFTFLRRLGASGYRLFEF